jgi:hypothetical protein
MIKKEKITEKWLHEGEHAAPVVDSCDIDFPHLLRDL